MYGVYDIQLGFCATSKALINDLRISDPNSLPGNHDF